MERPRGYKTDYVTLGYQDSKTHSFHLLANKNIRVQISHFFPEAEPPKKFNQIAHNRVWFTNAPEK